ncbi:molybdopterin molybdotransferase MoeA [Stratiformator vulcanicus]|uniref:Molybdopterin molybdenumtransferase n=1 Tax=Stratiformator vulcanicus TaxID=2527980 RepID=A0A517QWC2_9PLAN|nr:molybdopterin molybdotransferase MoeA [Stratiformator vulcanicus]QDT35873.1 Molybdopterin molybdenumtransferase [Stratiformator vulcanicus]
MADFQYQNPDDAIAAAVSRLRPVATETIRITEAGGRVLATDLMLDRDSPACDVSAMDGFAVRIDELTAGSVPVSAEAAAGHAPPTCKAGTAVRIFTGAPVPPECDTVIKREDVHEAEAAITLKDGIAPPRIGSHIRRRGENGLSGHSFLQAGSVLTPAALAGAATCGAAEFSVYRRVRVAIVTTGDELCRIDQQPESWQIRDSNGFALRGLFQSRPYLDVATPIHAPDKLTELTDLLKRLSSEFDAIFLTGGVSVGDRDFVPKAVKNAGGEIIFHKLPIRPGKPLLTAVQDGTLIAGLPGNPVSVLYTGRRFGVAYLQHLAGFNKPEPVLTTSLLNADEKSLHLHWGRLVQLEPQGARLLESRGSGDVINASQSDGFIEIPAGQSGRGPWKYFSW